MFVFDTNTGPIASKPVAARSGVFHLPHGDVRTPIFMPVATQAALKGITVEQLEELDVEIILGNTYHLALRPGEEVLRELTRRKNMQSTHLPSSDVVCESNKNVNNNNNPISNQEICTENNNNFLIENGKIKDDHNVQNNMDGIHFLQNWRRNILTDSGGFQMVSLLKLANITEEGVRFQSTHGGAKMYDDNNNNINVETETTSLTKEEEVCDSKQIEKQKPKNDAIINSNNEEMENSNCYKCTCNVETETVNNTRKRLREGDHNGETTVVTEYGDDSKEKEVQITRTATATATATKTNLDVSEVVNDGNCEGNDSPLVKSSYSLLLRPEDSIRIQNAIGGDVMMQLDDVVHVLTTGERVREAAERSIRWLDRCIASNQNARKQGIFGIVQGGLDLQLRQWCLNEIVQRRACVGFAIGGLSGGEAKDDFWRVVRLCTANLPHDKPRYCMGVGYPEDILVCIALGVDMFDCVFACRTARFGSALTSVGKLQLNKRQFANDFTRLDPSCTCATCTTYTRAYLHLIAAKDRLGATLISYHNIAYLINLTRGARNAIETGTFTEFVQQFFKVYYAHGDYPQWAVDALNSVNIHLL